MQAFQFKTVEEAIAFIEEDKEGGFVVFASNEKVAMIREYCRTEEAARFDADRVIFCSSSGQITSSGFAPDVITGFRFDRSRASVVAIDSPPILSLNALKKAYEKVMLNGNAFMLLLSDGLSGMEEGIATSLFFVHEGFKIVGGSAGDDLAFKETLVGVGRRCCLAVAIFFDYAKRSTILLENIFELTDRRLLVTDADPMQRIVRTINGESAVTAYAKAIGVPESQLSTQFLNHPLGRRYLDDFYIASPMKANDDGSLTFYTQVLPNTFLYLIHPLDPRSVIEKTLQKIEYRPSFVLSIHCVLRSLKFMQEGIWKDMDRRFGELCVNHTGFVSYGEQYYRRFVNQTMVLLALE